MNYTFSKWTYDSPEAAAFRGLLARPEVWAKQRSDRFPHELVINRQYPGALLCIVWGRNGEAAGFLMFLPVGMNFTGGTVFELHMGFVGGFSIRKMIRAAAMAVKTLFTMPEVDRIIAPCPDWDRQLVRLGGLVRNHLKATHRSSYRVMDYAIRDGRSYGASVHVMEKGDF